MSEPFFLTLAEVVAIHSDQIARYGGEAGIRDMRLLESAIAQPQISFEGKWFHSSLTDMAVAYAFHISQNHPFYDGNKRTALASTLVFLRMHDIRIRDPKSTLAEVMYRVAKGEMDKQELADFFKKLS